jgi:hypothetical protein
MMTALRYGYLDESGGTGIASPGGSHLLVAAIVVARPRVLDTIIRRARERFPFVSQEEELKAAHSVDRLTRWVLTAVEREEVSIVAVVAERPTVHGAKGDAEAMYRRAVACAVGICLERWPRLIMTLDKRYTQQYLRDKLEVAIRERTVGTPETVLVIRQEDSRRSNGLQVVDFVAWAIGQKYQRGDTTYYDLIRSRVHAEVVLRAD